MRSACAIALAVVIAGGTALAQPPQQRPARPTPPRPTGSITRPVAATPAPALAARAGTRFETLDVNKDGKLAPTELKVPAAVFRSIDADHNGSVCKAEATRAYLAFVGYLALREKATAFKAMDGNHDGKLTPAEFKGAKPLFTRIDVNKDGAITAAESRAAFEGRVRQAMGVAILAAMDTNKDGAISAAEFVGPKPAFAKLDRNRDGVITRADSPVPRPPSAVAAVKPTTPTKPVARVAKPVNKPVLVKPAAKPTKPVSVKPAAKPTKVVAGKPAAKPTKPVAPVVRRVGVARVEAMVRAVDLNQDGRISRREYVKPRMAQFRTFDRNHDGVLIAAEVSQGIGKGPVAHRTTQSKARGKVMTKPPVRPVATRPAATLRVRAFMAFDANHDGKITRAEYVRGLKARFEKADRDQNRTLTRAEISQTFLARNAKTPATATRTAPVAASARMKAQAKSPAKPPVKVKSTVPTAKSKPIRPAKGRS